MGENPGVLLGIFQWRNSITLAWTTKFHTMFMGECKTMVHGEAQPTLGVFREFEIPIGKKLLLVMALT